VFARLFRSDASDLHSHSLLLLPPRPQKRYPRLSIVLKDSFLFFGLRLCHRASTSRSGPSAGSFRLHRLQNASSRHSSLAFLPRFRGRGVFCSLHKITLPSPLLSPPIRTSPSAMDGSQLSGEATRSRDMGSSSLRYAPRIFFSRPLHRHPRCWAFYLRITNTHIFFCPFGGTTRHATCTLVLIASLLFPSWWTSRNHARGFKLSRTHRCAQCRATFIVLSSPLHFLPERFPCDS
jgi:hypothetical protein